jgi:hypothetical protein
LQPSGGEGTSDTDYIEAYGCIRAYIEEENRLVAERISRTLLVHGFLIASFVLLIQAKAQAIAQAATATNQDVLQRAHSLLEPIFRLADVSLPLIAAMGLLTSIAALAGVAGATFAMGSLRELAKKLREVHSEQSTRLCSPIVTGGGNPVAALLGWLAAYGLLILLIVFWAAIGYWSAPWWGGPPRW